LSRREAPVPSLSAHRHLPGQDGSLDESERRLPWDELLVAQILVQEGHHVRSLHERAGNGPRPDFDVCGVKTEVKTLDRGASAWTLANAMTRGRDQGEVVIINARDSGLSRRQADLGARRFAEKAKLGRIGEARIIGANFSLSYSRSELQRMATRRPPERGVGL
jgi:hypothetical protein